ncbi:PTS sugar transporter subunit IIA [Sedimentitalea todarodis]|uniref:PTS fructose transporter subunit IIA n=1 Tax=Sedimentitalea todarodis TaxID=1631240 RepID=A0ABU3V9D5_9RHOB|nr:PTS fructose transporter subunit IIA [Sedimentitalea todarodis]MDU9002778.1 PTS fructose transporter subunit IIA [Sedimentitalea todarodis]
MIGIVIVAHGGLAREFLAATEHIIGKPNGICAIGIEAVHDRAAVEQEICDAADAVDTGDGVVVVVDLHGGSPCNLALKAVRPEKRRIVFGVNLPLLVQLAKHRDEPVADAVRIAIDAGKKYIFAKNISSE